MIEPKRMDEVYLSTVREDHEELTSSDPYAKLISYPVKTITRLLQHIAYLEAQIDDIGNEFAEVQQRNVEMTLQHATAVAAEREACAEVVMTEFVSLRNLGHATIIQPFSDRIVAAIRQRSAE